jgi:hypothetical protein
MARRAPRPAIAYMRTAMLDTHALSGSSPGVRSELAASAAPHTDGISPPSASVGDALRKKTQAFQATSRSDVDAARRPSAEHAASLDIDLAFQDFGR